MSPAIVILIIFLLSFSFPFLLLRMTRPQKYPADYVFLRFQYETDEKRLRRAMTKRYGLDETCGDEMLFKAIEREFQQGSLLRRPFYMPKD